MLLPLQEVQVDVIRFCNQFVYIAVVVKKMYIGMGLCKFNFCVYAIPTPYLLAVFGTSALHRFEFFKLYNHLTFLSVGSSRTLS